MKPQEFQYFLARLGELTKEQRRALSAAMAGTREDAIALIEARFSERPFCPHCQSAAIQPWGTRNGLERRRCRACRRTFTALTGTALSGLHKRGVWLDYAKAMVDHASVRKAAEICGIDKTTSFRWRHRFLDAPRDNKATTLVDIVEVDETFFRESFKGTRQLLRRPRKRGGKADKPGLSAEQIPVLIARDRQGSEADAVLQDLSDKSVAGMLRPLLSHENVLVSDGAYRYLRFAEHANLLHVSLNHSAGERRWGVYHINNVNAQVQRLKDWMRPFRGVATANLPNYLGWHRVLDRPTGAPSPAALLADALD